LSLDEVQERLKDHFGALSAARKALGYPVYAIEHDFSEQERAAVRGELDAGLRSLRLPSPKHWLVWIAAAAEVGYAYDGDEYWQSFAAAFPSWRVYGNRELVRTWYKDFVQVYRGVRPQGAWAQQFPIIALPITHAIVPHYLQRLLIDHVSNCSGDLRALGDASASEIGTVLRDRYYGGFRRFSRFLEETELTGRLILALRDEEIEEQTPRFSPPTFRRIVGDIEGLPQSASKLRRVQRVLREARVAAQSRFYRSSPSIPGRTGTASTTRPAKLFARRDEDGRWSLRVRVSGFEREMLANADALREVDRGRVRFTDAAAGWMPGAALRTYAKGFERIAKVLPIERPLLEIQGDNEKLSPVLTAATMLSGPPPYLLRCHIDTAHQVEGRHVRAGESYLWLSSAAPTEQFTALFRPTPLHLELAGLIGVEFAAPSHFERDHLAALTACGIGHAVTVRIGSAGLSVRWSEAEAAQVWLDTEEPILRLTADFPVSEYVIDLDNDRTRIPTTERSMFVSLGKPGVGRHVLEVGATTPAPGLRIQAERFEFIVRPSESWTANTPTRSGLDLIAIPNAATIEDVIAGRASIEVRGPPTRPAEIRASLYANNGEEVRDDRLHRARLPIQAGQLRKAIETLARPDWSEAMESAARVELRVSVDGLGSAHLDFAHAVEPIRWKLERVEAQWIGRLIDEGDNAPDIRVAMFSMSAPADPVSIATDDALRGIALDPPGALLLARHNGLATAAAMSLVAGEGPMAIQDMLPECRCGGSEDDSDDLRRLVRAYRLWTRAVLRGPWAQLRRAHVQRELRRAHVRVLAGDRWAEQWSRFIDGEGDLFDAIRDIREHIGFGPAVVRSKDLLTAEVTAAASAFADLAERYRVEDNKAVSRDAALLAFDPDQLAWKTPTAAREASEQLVGKHGLIKGAYLAAALRARQEGECHG
jgi:hypothetical protein